MEWRLGAVLPVDTAEEIRIPKRCQPTTQRWGEGTPGRGRNRVSSISVCLEQ